MHTSPCKGRWLLENGFVRKGIAVVGPKDVHPQFGEEPLDVLHDASGQIASERRDLRVSPGRPCGTSIYLERLGRRGAARLGPIQSMMSKSFGAAISGSPVMIAARSRRAKGRFNRT